MFKLTALITGGAALTAALIAGSSAPVSPAASLEEHEGRAPTAIELTPGVQATFPYESYAPRSTAMLEISNRARGLQLQLFHVGPDNRRGRGRLTDPPLARFARGG